MSTNDWGVLKWTAGQRQEQNGSMYVVYRVSDSDHVIVEKIGVGFAYQRATAPTEGFTEEDLFYSSDERGFLEAEFYYLLALSDQVRNPNHVIDTYSVVEHSLKLFPKIAEEAFRKIFLFIGKEEESIGARKYLLVAEESGQPEVLGAVLEMLASENEILRLRARNQLLHLYGFNPDPGEGILHTCIYADYCGFLVFEPSFEEMQYPISVTCPDLNTRLTYDQRGSFGYQISSLYRNWVSRHHTCHLDLLKEGKRIEIDGFVVEALVDPKTGTPRPVQPGDFYVAHRNGSPVLLTAKTVDHENIWVQPEEIGRYVYNLWECVPVNLLDTVD